TAPSKPSARSNRNSPCDGFRQDATATRTAAPAMTSANWPGNCSSNGSRQAAAAARAQRRLPWSSAVLRVGSDMRQQRQCAQAGVAVGGALVGPERWLAGQHQPVTAAVALGL